MTSATISPFDARRRIEDGSAILVDIREPAEYARESIPGAKLTPLSKFDAAAVRREAGDCPAVIFHCQGGNRTRANAQTLEACGVPEVYMLEGGLQGWKAAGLPSRLDRRQPIEMPRQVQIGAGSLVVVGLALGATVSPWFVLLSAFVGCGLVFAGVSGWCGMARLLAVMPWNRATA